MNRSAFLLRVTLSAAFVLSCFGVPACKSPEDRAMDEMDRQMKMQVKMMKRMQKSMEEAEREMEKND